MKKIKEMSLIKKIICIVLIVGVIGIFTNGSDKEKETPKKDVSSKQTIEEKEYGINEVVKVGNVDYQVNQVEVTKQIGSEYFNTTAKDTFLIINLSITNNEKEALSVSDSFFKLLNGENEYSTDSSDAIYLENDSSIIYKELNPGVTLQGKIIFDVPEAIANDMATKLQVQTGIWGTEKDLISLAR